MSMLGNYALRGVANVTLFNLATGLPALYSDYAQATSQTWSSEQTFAHAAGARSVQFDHGREGTLDMTFEIFDLSMIAIVAGSDVTSSSTNVMRREVGQLADGNTEINLSRTPQIGSVAVVPVSPLNNVTFVSEPLRLDEDFTVDGSTVTILEPNPNVNYAVHYASEVASARTITINANRFPIAYKITGDALVRNQSTGVDEWMALEVFNARPISNFELTMSADDVTTLEVSFNLFPDSSTGDMMKYSVIEGDVPTHHPDFDSEGN